MEVKKIEEEIRDMGTGNSSTQKMEIDNNPKGRLLMNSHKENHVN
ncbi:hypothetical protein [Sutcliffiella cohnii]|nr:hypothetical protein [Sutcliffiella cohnii]